MPLGRKHEPARNPEPPASGPRLERLLPAAAMPGGDVRLEGESLRAGEAPEQATLPEVRVGGQLGLVLMSSSRAVIARIPEGALSGGVRLSVGRNGRAAASNELHLEVAVPITENLHPVANPAIDAGGNIFATFSGSRGQSVPVSLFQVDTNYNVKPLGAAVTNPTGLAFDRGGALYVTGRNDGAVYRVAPNGAAAIHAEGLGVATGLAFDRDDNLYVGDRSGTIFKIDRNRSTFVFATLEPSVAAYHLAFGPDRFLYVSGPTTSSFDAIWRISPRGEIEAFFRGLGRPQGMAFDRLGNLYVVGSLRGRRGVVRVTPQREAELVISGYNLVGLAFARGPAMILATNSGLFHLDWNTPGLPLPVE